MAWLMKLGMGRPNLLTSPAMILQVLTMSSVQFILVGGLIIGDDILPNYIWGLFHIANIRIPMEPIRMTHGMSYRTVSFSVRKLLPRSPSASETVFPKKTTMTTILATMIMEEGQESE